MKYINDFYLSKVYCYLNSSLCYILCFLLLASCSFEDKDEFQPLPKEKLVSILYEKTITLKETIEDVIVQNGITEEMLKPYKKSLKKIYALNIRYEVYAITYHTVTPQGHSIIASGVLYYPKRRPLGVIEITPVNKSKGYCGTELCTMAEVIPGMIGYICLVPDLIGYGVSKDLPISYLQHKNVAKVSADFRQAADELISLRKRQRLSKNSILCGYSLGGSGTMALARYYTLHTELGVKVTHIFAGGGAYNPAEVIKAQLSINRSDYAIIPNILYSMDYYDNLNLDYRRIFKGELLENYKNWCDGNMSISELTKKLGYDLRVYLSEDIINGLEKNEDFELLRNALKDKIIPHDWVPEGEVHLYHSRNDYYVPSVCGDQMYKYLNESGAKVTYKLYDEEHVISGFLMGKEFFEFLRKL